MKKCCKKWKDSRIVPKGKLKGSYNLINSVENNICPECDSSLEEESEYVINGVITDEGWVALQRIFKEANKPKPKLPEKIKIIEEYELKKGMLIPIYQYAGWEIEKTINKLIDYLEAKK